MFLLRWLTVFPGGVLIFRFGSLGGRVYAKGGLGCVRAGKTVQRIEAHKKSPPCVKGGRGGSRRGDRRGWDVSLWRATGGGQGAWGTDVGGWGDRLTGLPRRPRLSRRSQDCPPLAQGRLFLLGGKIPRRPGVGPVGAVGGIRLLLQRGLPLLG